MSDNDQGPIISTQNPRFTWRRQNRVRSCIDAASGMEMHVCDHPVRPEWFVLLVDGATRKRWTIPGWSFVNEGKDWLPYRVFATVEEAMTAAEEWVGGTPISKIPKNEAVRVWEFIIGGLRSEPKNESKVEQDRR